MSPATELTYHQECNQQLNVFKTTIYMYETYIDNRDNNPYK